MSRKNPRKVERKIIVGMAILMCVMIVAIPVVSGGVEIPKIPKVPKVDVPKVPKVDVPKIPKVDVPNVPKVDVPPVEIPDIPKVDVPDIPNYDVYIPHGTVHIDIPEIPKVDVPDIPYYKVPDIQCYDFRMDIPEIPDVYIDRNYHREFACMPGCYYDIRKNVHLAEKNIALSIRAIQLIPVLTKLPPTLSDTTWEKSIIEREIAHQKYLKSIISENNRIIKDIRRNQQ